MSVAIHWYRNGLRFHDNPCLKDACDNHRYLLPLYVIDPEAPFAQTKGHRAGCIRANFVLESIQEVDCKLKDMNSQILVLVGKPEHVIPEVVALFQVNSLYYEQEAAEPMRISDAQVLKAVRDRCKRDGSSAACTIKAHATHTLHPMEKYLAKCKGGVAPATYGGFTKIFQSMKVPSEVETVTRVPSLPDNAIERLARTFGRQPQIPTLEELGYENVQQQLENRKKGGIDFDGGEEAGLTLLHRMMSRSRWVATFEKPKTSPNALTVDTTGLSPCKLACVQQTKSAPHPCRGWSILTPSFHV